MIKLKMDNYFKERMDEIQLRTEQMAARKTQETEVDALEEKLRNLEINYERLHSTYKSNLEQYALRKVDLTVAKATFVLAEETLEKKRTLLVEEKRKLNNLHRKVWEEQIMMCEEVRKCLAENDSVRFLNSYPLVLKTQPYNPGITGESDAEIKIAASEDPAVKELAMEVAALERELRKAENNEKDLTEKLRQVLAELETARNVGLAQGDETQRLIESLECSHRERIALEAELADLEYSGQTKSKDSPRLKNEDESGAAMVNQPGDEISAKNAPDPDIVDVVSSIKVKKEKDKKSKAKQWYEDYARMLKSATETENDTKSCTPPSLSRGNGDDDVEDDVSVVPESQVEIVESSKFFPPQCEIIPPKKLRLRNAAKPEENFPRSQETSPFFKNNKTDSPQDDATKPKRCVGSKKGDDHHEILGALRTSWKGNRKLEPLMATPSSLLKVPGETKLEDSSQSRYDEVPSTTSGQGIRAVKKSVRFVPKKPSNIGKRAMYRQRKLDNFHEFMLS